MSDTETIKSEEGKHAAEALQVILKAKKNLRLYPENNPIYAQTIKEAYRKVMLFFSTAETMELLIHRNEIKLGEEVVYTADSKDENLALFLFRDGLRSITIGSGLQEDEFLDFLDAISHDFDSEDSEEDLVTLLWEKDFKDITYKIDDSDLVDEDDGYDDIAEEQAKKDANQEGNVQSAYSEVVETDEPPEGIIPVAVTDEDLAALESEIENDRKSKFPKLIDILFDLLYTSDSLDEFKDVVDILSNSVHFAVKNANLTVAISVFKRAKEVHERTRTPEAKAELNKLLSFAGSPSLIAVIGKWLDSPSGINESVYKEYVSILGPAAIPHFIALLGKLETVSGRKAAIYALSVFGKKDFKALSKGLSDDRWFVVRNIIVTFKNIGDKRALDHLPAVLKHSEPRVRKEALKLFGEMGGPAAVNHISEHLYSSDHSVEVVAAQALSRIGTDSAKAALLEKITAKGFQELKFSRMKPFYEAIARFRAMDIFEFLMQMLQRTPVFGRAKYNEMKACAMYALGLMGSPKALPALEEQRNSKDDLVREYATTAIKRIKHVQQRK